MGVASQNGQATPSYSRMAIILIWHNIKRWIVKIKTIREKMPGKWKFNEVCWWLGGGTFK